MSLNPGDRATIERWAGPILDADELTTEERLTRLGNAYMVALELLQITWADMDVSAADVASGDDRSNHEKNMAAVKARVDRLVSYILANNLGTDDGLLGEATTAGVASTATITIDARNRRRAGR